MNLSNLDFAKSWQLLFQDPATPIMEGILDLHHNIFFFLLLILFLVLYILFSFINKFYYSWINPNAERLNLYQKNYLLLNSLVHGTKIEIIWTLIPSFILLLIAVPSFSLLYSMDEVIDPVVTIKVVGHQWYWSYEYGDYSENINFDSYMLAESDLNLGDLRLLEVDNSFTVPSNCHIRLLVTSADVLHSFTLPSLGIKVDAVPGRLNQLSFFLKRNGTFYGQCSELCGVNHAFMPIVLKAKDLDEYLNWLEEVK